MEAKQYQFCVNTSKNCFLCLKIITKNDSNTQNPTFSLNSILLHLKISLCELSTLSKKSPEILNKTDIRISLCSDCEVKVKTFCEHFKALELLKMKVESSMEAIKKTVSELNCEDNIETKHCRIVKELRQTIKNKNPNEISDQKSEAIVSEELIVKLESEESLTLGDTTTEEMESILPEVKVEDSKKCDLCRKEFISDEELQKHLKYHNQESPFLCKKCEMDFSSKEALKIHMDQKIHKKFNVPATISATVKVVEPEVVTDPLAIPDPPSQSPEGPVNLQCNICGKVFHKEEMFKIHSLKVHTEKNLPCSVCNEVFPSRLILNNHLKTHRQDRPFKCHLCSMAYTLKTRLCRHMRTAHGGKQRPLECSDCGMRFLTKQNLKQHLETHKGQKFQCTLCPSQFKSEKGLRFHFKTLHGSSKK